MIQTIQLQNFRSYHDKSFSFKPGVNIIIGPNASGKTNLLEAILVVAQGKSYRAKDAELIKHNASWARLDSQTTSGTRAVKLERQTEAVKKTFIIEDKPLHRLLNNRRLPVVLFEPNHEGLGLQDEYLRSDGVGRDFLKISAGGSLMPTTAETVKNKLHNIIQDGKTVFKYAVTNMADASELILQRNNLTNQDVNWLVPHQANKRIIDATASRMNLEESKVLMNIEKYGNTTSATLPLVLSEFEKQFKKGDNIIFAAFGGGFTWGSIYLKWAYDTK